MKTPIWIIFLSISFFVASCGFSKPAEMGCRNPYHVVKKEKRVPTPAKVSNRKVGCWGHKVPYVMPKK